MEELYRKFRNSGSVIFKNAGAYVKFKKVDNHAAMLGNLFSYDRKKGYATEVLNQATAFADKFHVHLMLKAKRFRDGYGLTNEQLITFYEKFGFEKSEQDPQDNCWIMIRDPLSHKKHTL